MVDQVDAWLKISKNDAACDVCQDGVCTRQTLIHRVKLKLFHIRLKIFIFCLFSLRSQASGFS